MADQHNFKTEKTARYFQLGKINEQTEEVWIVLHGYGQLAEYFIRRFRPVQSERRAIVAPEGLSRFYLEGFSGRVGATWMTKEERMTDIEDNLSYLNDLAQHITSLANKDVRLNLLGFSQGAATAVRWFCQSKFTISHLIIWAGIFPPEIGYDELKDSQSNAKFHLVYGNKDPFLKESFKEQIEKLRTSSLPIEIIEYEGVHKVDGEVLRSIIG